MITVYSPQYGVGSKGLRAFIQLDFSQGLTQQLVINKFFQGDPAFPRSIYVINYSAAFPIDFVRGGDTDFIPAYSNGYIDITGQDYITFTAQIPSLLDVQIYTWENPPGFTQRGIPPPGSINDPLWSYVVDMLHMQAANGAVSAPNTKRAANPIAAFGTAQISTAKQRFAGFIGSSLKFTRGAIGSSYANISGNSGIAASTLVTIEFSYYLDSSADINDGVERMIMFLPQTPVSSANDTYLAMTVKTKTLGGLYEINWYMVTGGAPALIRTDSTTADTWHNVAVTINGITTRLFYDGVLVAGPLGNAPMSVTQAVYFGGATTLYASPNMYVAEVRITNAVRYTVSYTPETQPFFDY